MIGEATSSKIYSNMGKHAGKSKKRYLDHSRDQLKLTSLIFGLGQSSEQLKVLNRSDTKYAAGKPFI